jgi:hypothetical protein
MGDSGFSIKDSGVQAWCKPGAGMVLSCSFTCGYWCFSKFNICMYLPPSTVYRLTNPDFSSVDSSLSTSTRSYGNISA